MSRDLPCNSGSMLIDKPQKFPLPLVNFATAFSTREPSLQTSDTRREEKMVKRKVGALEKLDADL